ncbi:hypothetical protein [Flavisolibacter nicotianae]|uniref:hypothetical protein n=1 Tax=Flavisolibacter nicotianae TaxID=2364882 RepID=UPI000EB034E1|nr:hypothetical protein [Flavisolibacter nicotianae]
MKKVMAAMAVLCIALGASAQTWDEWFRQKKTQIKYLVEQLSALRIYGSAVKKGYDLANSGLQTIGHLKESDLALHQEHFTSLLQVKEGVKDSKVLQRMNSLQTAIQRINTECRKRLLNDGEFTTDEKGYFAKVLNNVMKESTAIGQEAVLLTSDGNYQMADDERLKRLQALLISTEDLYVFLRQFRNNLATMALNRMREQIDAQRLRSLY